MSRLLNFFSDFTLPISIGFSSRIMPRNFNVAITYLLNKYGLVHSSSEQIYSNLIFSSSIIFPTAFLSLSFLNLNPLLHLTLSITITILLYLLLYYTLISEYSYDLFVISQNAYTILNEISLVLNSTGSLFEALNFVRSGNYPIVSKFFEQVLKHSFNGEVPEKLLVEFSNIIPSSSIKNDLNLFLLSPKIDNKDAHFIKATKDEALTVYEKNFSKLELYSLLIIFIGLLTPITYVLVIVLIKPRFSFTVILILSQLIFVLIFSYFFSKKIDLLVSGLNV